MKKILSTLSQKWPEYLLEILVLIIGIYGAFAVDNWNESRKARASEVTILNNLKTEVGANISVLDATMKKRQQSFYCGTELLKLFSTDVSNIPSSYLDTLMTFMETVWTFESRDGTIKSIISSGNLGYIQNDSIRAMITAFDGEVVNATQETTHAHRILHERLWPEIDGKINATDRLLAFGYNIPAGSYESDYQWMFNNRRMEDVISNVTSWHQASLDDEEKLMNYLLRFRALVNEELAERK